MDNIINSLIEIDKKARSIVEEAENKSQDIINSISFSQKGFEIKYDNKAKLRLKKVKDEEAEKIKNNSRLIKDKYEVLIDKLERSYFQHHEEIENEIFNRVLNID